MVGWLATRVATVSRHQLPSALVKRLRFVTDEALLPLCRGLAERDPSTLAWLLSRLPHVRRGALFQAAVAGLERAAIEWPEALLDVLPDWLRDQEAERMLGLKRAGKDASWRRRLLGFRDIDAAREVLERECRRSQATDRAEGYTALVRATGRARRGMAETLAFAARTKNEQDPVRLAVLGALAAVPARLFTDAPALDQVVSPIFEARDTSWATRRQATMLAHRLLLAHATQPQGAQFKLALSILERLAGQSGTADLPRLYPNLPRGAEHAIVQAVLPWVDAAQKQAQVRMVFALWQALGERAWNVPELQARVEHAVWKGPQNSAAHAASLWLADPRTRDERVRALLKKTKSAIYLHPVMQHCHRRRQTWLRPRFDLSVHRGRFHNLRVVPVPHLTQGLERWTPDLQQHYEALVRAALADPKRFSSHRAGLIALLGRIPRVRVDAVLAAVRKQDVVELEAALGVLVWNDEPAPALPILLEHLDGDRARVAMYAVPRLANILPTPTLVEALAGLLARPKLKVTVHKEAVRLLGQAGTPRALDLLLAEWAKPLHRDVRIAALHAARVTLSVEAAWTILEAAAEDADADIARAVVEVFAPNVPLAFQSRYLDVMLRVAEHPTPEARKALFDSLASWALAAPQPVTAVASRVLTRLDPLDPWADAVGRLVDGARSPAAHPLVLDAVDLLMAVAETERKPQRQADLPARRRLEGLADAVAGETHATVQVLGVALAERLAQDPTLWVHAVRVRLATAPSASLGTACVTLEAAAPAPALRIAVSQEVARACASPTRAWTQAQALKSVDAAMASAPLSAVALVGTLGPRWGWPAAWLTRLETLRNQAQVGARAAALAVRVG